MCASVQANSESTLPAFLSLIHVRNDLTPVPISTDRRPEGWRLGLVELKEVQGSLQRSVHRLDLIFVGSVTRIYTEAHIL